MGRNSGGVGSMSPSDMRANLNKSTTKMLNSGGGTEATKAFTKVVNAMPMANRKALMTSLEKKSKDHYSNRKAKLRNYDKWRAKDDGYRKMINIVDRKIK